MSIAPLQKSISRNAWVEMALISLFWGGSFLSVRLALNEVPVMTTVAHRVFWAMLVLWGYVIWARFPIPRSLKTWGAFLVMGFLNNALPFTLMSWGQLYIESGLTSILNAVTAIFGVIVAAMFFSDERLTPSRIIGVLLGFFGVATAIGLNNLLAFDIRSTAQLAVILGTIGYALAGVWARKTMCDLKPQVAAAGMLTGATIIMVPLALMIDGVPSFNLSPVVIGAIAYYAIIATAVAYLLYYRLLAMVGSGNLMICTLLVAPVAIVLGAVVLGEQLETRAYVGFVILGLGLLVLDGRILRLASKNR